MPKAKHDVTTYTPTRRTALSGTAAAIAGTALALLGGRAAAAAGPTGDADAALLALHRDFLTQDALCYAWGDQKVSEEIGEAAHDRWWEIIEAAEKMPARTLPGLRAKADIALKGIELSADSQSPAEDLVRSTLAEIAAWGALS